MYGAILGDMIGAPYEFDRGGKTKDFPLFGKGTDFTDDTVMTVAVAEALMNVRERKLENDEWVMKKQLEKCLRHWGNEYPYAGYGISFSKWLRDKRLGAYGSVLRCTGSADCGMQKAVG